MAKWNLPTHPLEKVIPLVLSRLIRILNLTDFYTAKQKEAFMEGGGGEGLDSYGT